MKDNMVEINLIVGPVLRAMAYHSLNDGLEEKSSNLTQEKSGKLTQLEKIKSLYNRLPKIMIITSDRNYEQKLSGVKQNRGGKGKEIVLFSIEDMITTMDHITEQEAEQAAKRIADRFEDDEIDDRLFLDDAKYYLAIRRMLILNHCDEVSLSCRELCSLGIPQKKNFVSCIAISLLKEDGVNCTCEECCQKINV